MSKFSYLNKSFYEYLRITPKNTIYVFYGIKCLTLKKQITNFTNLIYNYSCKHTPVKIDTD